jgi:hypothetical protein
MNFSKGWIRASQFALACAGVLMVRTALAETSYPLVCQGPVNLETNGAWEFTWSMTPASTTPPGQIQCAWLDRTPRGSELAITGRKLPGGGEAGVMNDLVSRVNCPRLQTQQGLIVLGPNQYIEVMVAQDPTTHYMDVASWVGLVNPPFPSAPVEFTPATPCSQ